MTKDSDPKDESLSALACGCDPRENYKCAEHSKGMRCVLGHWDRMTNCPACQALLKEKKNDN